MLKIGILGLGHLGKIHVKCLQGLSDFYEIIGFYDPDSAARAFAEKEFGIRAFESEEELLTAADVIDIVTPTTTHFELAANALKKGKHLFIEKPVTESVKEAEQLIAMSQSAGTKVQIGHVERFNPALLALNDQPLHPMFIEGHRLAAFNPRGTDVSVILDLMIHDLDIVLHLVQSEIKFISASGVEVVSDSPDIANVRIEFENGCIANLTASRISLKQMRKLRFFQKDAYISLDFLDKQAQIVRLFEKDGNGFPNGLNGFELETNSGTKMMTMEMPEIKPINAIQMELRSLAESILNNTPVKVSLQAGYKALKVAHDIIAQIEQRRKEFSRSDNA